MTDRHPLDIAFFVDAFPDLSVTFVIDQVVGLLARGHRVRVFAQRPGHPGREHADVERWGLRALTTYIGPDEARGSRARRALSVLLKQPARAPRLLRTLPPWSQDALARSLRAYFASAHFRVPLRCDVVHCHFGPNGNLAAVLQTSGLLQAPIVTTFHGYDMRFAVPSRGAVYAQLRERGARFLAISGYNRQLLVEWGFDADRIVEHHVGIDVEGFAFREARAPHDDEIRVLCVANLVPVKGHEHLLRALHRLRCKYPELRVTVRLVGEGPQRPTLEAMLAEFGLTDVVSLLGGLPREAVREELQRADLFVLPSLAEATPVALMEAQACGVPVIATRVGAVHEVVREGRSGLLVEPGDDDALAGALRELCARRVEWPDFARAGRAHVLANYHLPRLLHQLETIYYDVLAARASRP